MGAYEAAAYSADTPYTPKNLLAKADGVTTRIVTLISGMNLLAGTVLGKISLGAQTVAAAVAFAGNTGTGTVGSLTGDAAIPAGNYKIVIIEPASNAGTFEVFKPDGTLDGTGTVAVAYNGSINFTLSDATDFIAGDGFTVAVSYAAGSGKYNKSLAAATDGSETPDLILAQDCDASAADTEAVAYETGTFVEEALVLGTGHTTASIREGLRLKGILIDT